MPRFRRRGRRFSRKPMGASITHVPSTMEQTSSTNTQSLIFSTVSTVTAGTSASSNRLETDRDREVSNGEKVGFTRFTLQMEPSGGATGNIEFVLFKAERQNTTPVIGTFPIPSNTDVLNQGIQQAYRLNMSTWVCKFGSFPVSGETPTTRNITINWAKFKKGTVKDGDNYCLAFFNRTDGPILYSVQMLYKSWR